MKVRDILAEKGNAVFTVSPDTTVYDALKLMADKNIGALLVKDNNKITGIFTERDYSRKVVLKGKFSKETTITEVMNDAPVFIIEATEIDECMSLMTNKFVRHLAVMRGNELLGIVSIGDVVKAIIGEQQFLIENLEHYISGTK